MRALVQRVTSASVRVGEREIGSIGWGLLVFLGIHREDTPADAAWLAAKIETIRLFADEAGKMNLALGEVGGRVLVVSQFTLHAATRKGTRPSFNEAAAPARAIPLYEAFLLELETALGHPPARGEFGAMMSVSLVNDGPVTILLDTREASKPGVTPTFGSIESRP